MALTGKRVALILLLVALLARLGFFVVDFGMRSLQMDLASFWTAGRAVDAGLSPYVNHVDTDPSLWDGVGRYRHSRFLYPPPAARLFQPLSRLPYGAVKYLWMVATLAAVWAAVAWSLRASAVGRVGLDRRLVAACLTAGFFPLLALLERGQVDGFTLLLIVAAWLWPRGRASTWAAGGLLALATLLKLHCVFLVPFLLLGRRWRLLGGLVAGGALLALAALAIDGPEVLRGWALDELPRIARHGEGGTREMLLPPEAFGAVLAGVEPGRTVLDGKLYEPERLEFTLNASAVRTPVGRAIWSAARAAGLPLAPGHVALVILAVLVGAVAAALRGRLPQDPLLGCQIALVAVSLAAPVSWAMNVVWLLPATALLVTRPPTLGFKLVAVGFAVAALPQGFYGAVAPLREGRFVIAQLVCLAGLVLLARGALRDGSR